MKNGKTVVVIDAGGRGAALVYTYSKSPHVTNIIAIPGNDLMEINIKKPLKTFPHLKTTSIPEIIEICTKEKADLIDVAQDNAVEAGLVNRLVERGFNVVGPSREAGRIEWDKAWARKFMKKYSIPSPQFETFESENEGISFLKNHSNRKWFIKASGLAEGKGALPAENNTEAIEKVKEMKHFGRAGESFVIEEWVEGEEFSYFAISDGKTLSFIGAAQDHKRVLNLDEGPNTGGMGCSTPPLILTKQLESQAKDIITKAVEGLKKEGHPYKGVIYLGGIVVEGKILVIEFNARWGDPEVEILAPSIKNDFYTIGAAVANESLHTLKITTDKKARVVVAGCSKGYPVNYSSVKGKKIYGIDSVTKTKGILFFPAGIKKEGKSYIANGGRLFYIVAEGKTVIEARKHAYSAISNIYIEGNNLHYRTDIGWRDIARLYQSN